MKILHLADIHARDADINEVEICLGHIIYMAKKERPDLIINAGDTFDSQDVKLDSKSTRLIFDVFSELADIAPVAGIIGTPSHDGKAATVLSHIRAEYPVYIAAHPDQIYLYEDGALEHGVLNRMGGPLVAAISLIPAPTKQFFKTDSDIKGSDFEIAQAMNALFAGFGANVEDLGGDIPHILVGHWNVTGSLISETQTLTGVDIEISKDQMALANADLVCLGHIHMHQQIGKNIFFSGSIYRNNYGEMDDKGFYIHEMDSNHYFDNSRFIETPTRKLAKLDCDLTIDGAVEEIDSVLYGFEPDDIKDSLLRATFKVYQDEVERVDKEKIEMFYLSAGAKSVDVRIVRIPRENVRSKNILKLKTLREKIIENAALKDEAVRESILAKADILETASPDDIIAEIAKGGEVSEESTITA